ncbi:MAG: Uma2 family endonuclease [Bacteroidota bacterium]
MRKEVTDIHQLDFGKSYSYDDYLSWKLEGRIELIRGKISYVPSAPSLGHQQLSGELYFQEGSYLKKNKCKVFSAPFDVHLPSPQLEDSDTVVQPDLCVVCDPAKLDRRGCHGAPDWVIEILSPSTAHKDLNEKFQLYQLVGVPEYWVVFPFERSLAVYLLNEEGHYQSLQPQPFTVPNQVPCHTLPGLSIDMEAIFEGLEDEDF